MSERQQVPCEKLSAHRHRLYRSVVYIIMHIPYTAYDYTLNHTACQMCRVSCVHCMHAHGYRHVHDPHVLAIKNCRPIHSHRRDTETHRHNISDSTPLKNTHGRSPDTNLYTSAHSCILEHPLIQYTQYTSGSIHDMQGVALKCKHAAHASAFDPPAAWIRAA